MVIHVILYWSKDNNISSLSYDQEMRNLILKAYEQIQF